MRCTEPYGLIADIKANGSAAVCQLISADQWKKQNELEIASVVASYLSHHLSDGACVQESSSRLASFNMFNTDLYIIDIHILFIDNVIML
jgi:hypothetical protein